MVADWLEAKSTANRKPCALAHPADGFHPPQLDDHLRTLALGDRATDQAGVAALGHHRHPVRRAGLNHRR
jgi:hypothetical protein